MESKKQETTDLLGTLYHLVEPYLIPAGIVIATLATLYYLITRVAIHQFAVWKEVHGYSTGEVITAPIKYPWTLFRERVLRKPPGSNLSRYSVPRPTRHQRRIDEAPEGRGRTSA